jgi:RPA family protein
MASFAREVARRVYAQELRDSDLSFRENEDQYAPLYLITPTGARCNRVLVVGTLTEKDNLGDDVEYWRGRVADPAGSIFVYAGQYQPDAAQALAGTEPSSASQAFTRPRTGRG